MGHYHGRAKYKARKRRRAALNQCRTDLCQPYFIAHPRRIHVSFSNMDFQPIEPGAMEEARRRFEQLIIAQIIQQLGIPLGVIASIEIDPCKDPAESGEVSLAELRESAGVDGPIEPARFNAEGGFSLN